MKKTDKERIYKYLDELEELHSHKNNWLLSCEGWDSDGRFFPIEQSIADILRSYSSLYKRLDNLQAEYDKIKDEKWKDKELQDMKNKLDRVYDEIDRGFGITKEESEAIQEWIKKHLDEKHPKHKDNPGYFGAIGGNFTYEFIPTSIGVIGTIKCSCGDEFTFRELT